jgi:dUTP pyrophosphatase
MTALNETDQRSPIQQAIDAGAVPSEIADTDDFNNLPDGLQGLVTLIATMAGHIADLQRAAFGVAPIGVKLTEDAEALVDKGIVSDLLPAEQTEEAAGADVRAAISDSVTLQPGESQLIGTGLRFDLPTGYEMQVRPRSGLAYKNGITVLNGPGTIDADYTGEVGIILINHSDKPFVVEPGMRIAQLVPAQTTPVRYKTVDEVEETERGSGGFGSTGTD